MQIGDRLREARRQRHLSLQQVAESVGISAATLSRIETGKQSLDIQLLLRLAETLGSSAADFLPAAENALGHLQRSLERLTPETRSALWATLAERAARFPVERRDPMCVRLAEVVAQIDLLRAEVESVRKEVEAGAAGRLGRRSAP